MQISNRSPNLPLNFLVSHKGWLELILNGEEGFWLTDIFHRKCCQIYAVSPFTWKLRNERMNLSRPKWETNNQINQETNPWGLEGFVSCPNQHFFSLLSWTCFFCPYFYFDFYLFETSVANILACSQFKSKFLTAATALLIVPLYLLIHCTCHESMYMKALWGSLTIQGSTQGWWV